MENKIICKICGGKGGWKINRENWFDNSWQDCLYCDTFGFILSEKADDIQFLLAYNGYRKIIIDTMESLGKVISYKTKNMAETIEIEYLPTDRVKFTDFIKRLSRLGYYNNRVAIEVQQVFFYEPTIDKLNSYWRLSLKPDELKDLDGFVDFIRSMEG